MPVEVQAPRYLWEPQEGPQSAFYYSQADEVLYGGAAGGGKSDALLGIAGSQTRNPHYTALLLRRTLKELSQAGGLIERSMKLLSGYALYNAQEYRWKFPSGAMLQFGYCETDRDVERYQGSSYAVICFDELTKFTEYQYKTICGYVRSPGYGLRKLVRAATNPGSIGHAWVKARFVDKLQPFEIVRVKRKGVELGEGQEWPTRQWIPARVYDNKVLLEQDPQYVVRLQGLPEPWRTALLDGDWNIFSGQALPEWSYDRHTCEPYHLETWYPRLLAMDWGYSSNYCVLGLAVDTLPRVLCYRELYGKEELPPRVAEKMVRAFEGEPVKRVVLDRACWAKTGHAEKTIADQMDEVFREVGWLLEESDSDRLGGKMLLHEFLRLEPTQKRLEKPVMNDYWMKRFRNEGKSAVREFEEMGKEEVLPKLLIFRHGVVGGIPYGCPNLIRTLPTLVLDDDNPDDLDTTQEDHAYDTLRYGLKAIHGKAVMPAELVLNERLRGSEPSTIHLLRGWATKLLREGLTSKGQRRILYREKLTRRRGPRGR